MKDEDLSRGTIDANIYHTTDAGEVSCKEKEVVNGFF